jgi:hypothetical protein
MLKPAARAKAHEATFDEHLVENIVRSWTFAALEQVLRETSTASLPSEKPSRDVPAGSASKSRSFGGRSKEPRSKSSDPKLPSRSSSLNQGRSAPDMPYSHTAPNAQVVFENGQYHDRPAAGQPSTIPSAKNGLQELAGTRAQLLAIQRRLLEHAGKALGWSIGWNAIVSSLTAKEELTDVSLDEEEEAERVAEREAANTKSDAELKKSRLGISAAALLTAMSSLQQFRQFYEVCNLTLP